MEFYIIRHNYLHTHYAIRMPDYKCTRSQSSLTAALRAIMTHNFDKHPAHFGAFENKGRPIAEALGSDYSLLLGPLTPRTYPEFFL